VSRIFGEIRQNGYVVKDIAKAMEYWTGTLGVGPFFYVEKAPIRDFRYHGEPSDLDVSIALANTGALQIELIQQRNDAPSMYKEFLDQGHEGLQHIAYWTESFDADMARLKALGFRIGQEGGVGRNGRFVYFQSDGHPGSVIELSEISGAKGEFFKTIRDAAASWDGTDPVRKVG